MSTYPHRSLLLLNQSEAKAQVLYNHNPDPFKMPLIGPRPPYYFNPRYKQYYPVF